MAVLGISQALVEFEDNFREYGSFCSSREKIKHLLAHDDGNKMRGFLAARNPDNISSLSIESLLAKPMVVSRESFNILCTCSSLWNVELHNTYANSVYPGILFSLMLWWTILCLRAKRESIFKVGDCMKDTIILSSFTSYTGALRTMTRVADFINEVQRVCETYGSVLDSLIKENLSSEVWRLLMIDHSCYAMLSNYIVGWQEELEDFWAQGAVRSSVVESSWWAAG